MCMYSLKSDLLPCSWCCSRKVDIWLRWSLEILHTTRSIIWLMIITCRNPFRKLAGTTMCKSVLCECWLWEEPVWSWHFKQYTLPKLSSILSCSQRYFNTLLNPQVYYLFIVASYIYKALWNIMQKQFEWNPWKLN